MRLLDIIKKDVLVVLRDFQALVFIFLMPIVLIVILGLALSGIFDAGTVSIGQIHIAVVDEVSETEIAGANAQLGTNMGGSYDEMSLYTVLDSDEIQDFLSYSVVDADKADSLLEDGEVDAIVTIPAGYAQGLADAMYGSGESVSIDVLYEDPSLETTVAEGIVQSYADTLSSISADIGVLYQAVEQGASIQAMATLDVASYIQTAVSASIADTVEITSQGIEARPVINSYYYYSIAITCMFILYAAGQGSTFLYTESEDRTLQRLSAAGVPDTKLLLGKSFAVFCLCILQLIVLFGFSTLIFGINWGNTLIFVVIAVCVSLSVTGLGTLLMVMVYRAGNPRIGGVFQGVFVHAFALFGGSYVPLSVLPKFFSTVSYITPNGLAIKAFTENITGAPFSDIWPYLAGSIGIGLVLFVIGVMIFPRERRA